MGMDTSPARTSNDLTRSPTTGQSHKDALGDVLTLARSSFDDAPMGAVIACDDNATFSPVSCHGLALGTATLAPEHLFLQLLKQHTPQLILPEGPSPQQAAIGFYAGSLLKSADGTLLGLLAICDRKPHAPATPAQQALLHHLAQIAATLLEQRRIERRAAIVAQASAHALEGVVICDEHGNVRWHNQEAEHLLGELSIGSPLHQYFLPEIQDATDIVRDWLQQKANGSRQLRHAGSQHTLRLLNATRTTWEYEQEQGFTLLLTDVTDATRQREDLARLAHYDALTGLRNRNALLIALGEHAQWGVALIAIDKFKWINDGLGHTVGDRVLQAVADRLQALTDSDMCLARVGGDVFAIACSDARLTAADPQGSNALLQAIQQRLEQPLHIRGHEIQIECSTAVALRKDAKNSDLLACADLALNRAKSSGGRQLCRYHPAMRTDALARRDLDLELRRAFIQSEFELRYQPQVDLTTGKICGTEALLRWHHPQRGLVPAGEFIDLLSRSPLGAEVGAWVLQQACKDAAAWPDLTVTVSINLFPAQIHEGLVTAVEQALAASGLAANRLEIEITETTALTQEGVGATALAQLRGKGIQLAFDDFGTGYASLSMLQRFRIDRVKIDRSFVHGMLDNPDDAAIVRWIVMLAGALGLRVVAEGVEDQHQADLLRGLGCHEAQGYLYAQALDAGELLKRLHDQSTG